MKKFLSKGQPSPKDHQPLAEASGWNSQAGALPIFLLIAVVGILGFLFISNTASFKDRLFGSLFPKPPSRAASEPDTNIKNKTTELFGLNKEYNSAAASKRPEIIGRMKQIAKDRIQATSELLKTDPVAFLRVAIPSNLRNEFPWELRGDIEEDTIIEGTLEVLHSDDFVKEESKINYTLVDSNNKRYSIYFADKGPGFISGSKVSIKGKKLDNNIVARTSRGDDFKVITPPTNVLGTQTTKKIAVILFNFQNDTRQPFSPDQVRGKIFTDADSVNSYLNESSFGKLTIEGKYRVDGDVFGWYTIPFNINYSCEPEEGHIWANAAKDLITASGIDLSGYTNFIYFFPRTYCGGSWAYAPGTEAWINANLEDITKVVAHEFGHNLGMHHASSYICTDQSGTRQSISANCVTNEYWDPFDPMGFGLTYHYNNFHKGEINWLSPANTYTTTSGGTFDIFPIEQSSPGVQSLRIPRNDSDGNYYYIEYRRPFGFDNFSGSDPVTNGVSIRLAPDYSAIRRSWLIDTTPASSPDSLDFKDSSLTVGRQFNDPYSGVTIKTISTDSQKAVVQVSLANQSCTRANPTLDISPLGQYGSPGTALTYNLTITNNDNSSCGSSVFKVTNNLPADWSTNYTGTTTISPGISNNITVSVTSPANASTGLYTFTLNVINDSDNSYSAAISANYNISSTSCDTAAVGTNRLVGCLWDGTNFNVADGNAPLGPILSSPVPDSATALDINFNVSPPNIGGDTFSGKWKGNFTFKAGTYQFIVGSDDGLRFRVDGQTLLDKWFDRGYSEDSSYLTFSSQTTANLELDYYENQGGAFVKLYWIYTPLTTPPPPPPVGDTQAPSVAITSPADGATVKPSSTITLSASASDNVGVTRVLFYVGSNGSNSLVNTDTSAPYSYSYRLPGKKNAGYTITAVAYDAANNSSSDSITILAR